MAPIPLASSAPTARPTKKNYLFQRLARATFGTNNVDHHRTADYTGLITALGEHAADSLLTMDQLYHSKAVLLVGNDPTNQNPLAAWQIRTGIRHFGAKLFIINEREIKLHRKAKVFVKVGKNQEAAALRWLAHEEGQLPSSLVEQLVQLKAGLEAESDVAIVFGAEVSGAAIAQLVAFGSKLPGKTRYNGPRRLRQFPRRRRHGRAAGSPARLRAPGQRR